MARLNRFLALGLSAVVGAKSDEFSWKGLGSKLAFHSRRLTVETYTGSGPVRLVQVNAPWDTISDGRKPRPKIYESEPGTSHRRGTKVVVAGHPPDVRREYTFSQVKDLRWFLIGGGHKIGHSFFGLKRFFLGVEAGRITPAGRRNGHRASVLTQKISKVKCDTSVHAGVRRHSS